MIKIFFLLMIISIPGAETVRYNGSIYSTEESCIQAKDDYMGAFEAKPEKYKDKIKTEAFCIPFESFPVKGIKPNIGA